MSAARGHCSASWAPDYLEALHDLGYIDRRVLLQGVTIEHPQDEWSTVTIRCHLRPGDLAALHNHVAVEEVEIPSA